MKYKLKANQENFEIMSGADEGKKFVRGRAYEKPPKGYEDRFEKVLPVPKAKPQAPKPAPDKKAGATPKTEETDK